MEGGKHGGWEGSERSSKLNDGAGLGTCSDYDHVRLGGGGERLVRRFGAVSD
jgi:hypothetical protein